MFLHYRDILGEFVSDSRDGAIDLSKITNDFCCIDVDSQITIKRIPLKGDSVYFTVHRDDCSFIFDFEVKLSDISDKYLQHLIEIMRKAVTIEEQRNPLYIS